MPADNLKEFKEIIKSLNNRIYKPIYALHGTETYFIDEITRLIEENCLTEAEKGFNQTVFYANAKEKEPEIKTVIEACKRFPMMAERQVVIVKEAQNFKSLDDFEPYFKNPVPSTVLVLAVKGKKIDGRTALYKAAKKHVCFEAKPLYEEKELPAWIQGYLQERGFHIDNHNANLIASHIGSNLSKVSNELQKLLIIDRESREITESDIETYIGVSKEYNTFEFIKSIAQKNPSKAFAIVKYMAGTKDFNTQMIITQLNNFLAKGIILKQAGINSEQGALASGVSFMQAKDFGSLLSKYSLPKLEQMLSVMAEFDLKSKGIDQSNNDPHVILNELLFNLFV